MASSELVSRPDLVMSGIWRPGLGVPGERVCVTFPVPSCAYTRPLHYTVVGVDSANNTGVIGNVIRVTMGWEPRPERINTAKMEVRELVCLNSSPPLSHEIALL